jgi:hypothetical protein
MAFQRCVDACSGINTIISIPAGTFLLIPPAQLTNFNPGALGWPVAVTIKKGGIHFLGAGMDNTILMGCGAWKLQSGSALRGWLFTCDGPVTNNYPLIFEGLTMDGGVTNGNTTNHGFPANVIDGSGWDESHDALTETGLGPLHANKQFLACQFQHWRGEMVKMLTSDVDGFILVSNCVFYDGNATAWNDSFSHTITGCTFSNMYQTMEMYQGYNTNACFFSNNVMANMTGGTILAFNGAATNHVTPPYNIISNTFYPSVNGCMAIATGVGNNIYVTGNQFLCLGAGVTGIGCGIAGYQGSTVNSNIVVTWNNFSKAGYVLQILGGGVNSTFNALIASNTASGLPNYFAYGYGWSTNITFVGNIGDGNLNNTKLKGQWMNDDLSNQFPFFTNYDYGAVSNVVSYIYGAREQIWATKTNSLFALDDSHPSQIPLNSIMIVSNSGYAAPLYTSDTVSTTPIAMSKGYSATFQWNNGSWQLATTTPAPPTDLHEISP